MIKTKCKNLVHALFIVHKAAYVSTKMKVQGKFPAACYLNVIWFVMATVLKLNYLLKCALCRSCSA